MRGAIPKILVVEAYTNAGRAGIAQAGCSIASTLYRDLVHDIAPETVIDIVYATDPQGELPSGTQLSDYHGVIWTGSSLTIYHDVPEVTRQIDLARAVFAVGVPQFGSCWAIQIATVAAGGTCRKNPKGREFGIARDINLTAAGKSHPLFTGKSHRFDALASHLDEVETLPERSTLLASNERSSIQAAEICCKDGTFWGLQYHPEYNLLEIACLADFRREALIAEGFFADNQAAQDHIDKLKMLHTDKTRMDLIKELSIRSTVLETDSRRQEVANWLEFQAGIPIGRKTIAH